MKKNVRPTTTQVNRLRTWLRAQGVPTADASAFVRTALTMDETTTALRAWLKTRPKKSS